jgi:hypothetical protein
MAAPVLSREISGVFSNGQSRVSKVLYHNMLLWAVLQIYLLLHKYLMVEYGELEIDKMLKRYGMLCQILSLDRSTNFLSEKL